MDPRGGLKEFCGTHFIKFPLPVLFHSSKLCSSCTMQFITSDTYMTVSCLCTASAIYKWTSNWKTEIFQDYLRTGVIKIQSYLSSYLCNRLATCREEAYYISMRWAWWGSSPDHVLITFVYHNMVFSNPKDLNEHNLQRNSVIWAIVWPVVELWNLQNSFYLGHIK